jgi:hypothetical protein
LDGYDDPEILSYSTTKFCPISADAGQAWQELDGNDFPVAKARALIDGFGPLADRRDIKEVAGAMTSMAACRSTLLTMGEIAVKLAPPLSTV